jgi:methylmalonyl-CoA mutase
MNNSLFESDFPPNSSKEWMDKIVKDLRDKPYDSLNWHIDDVTVMDPYYTIQRNRDLDQVFHNVISAQLKSASWQIIQDLQNSSQEEINKALSSDVDIIQVNEHDPFLDKAAVQCFVSSKASLDSILYKYNNISILINPINEWISGSKPSFDPQLIKEDKTIIHLSSAAFHEAGADDFEEISLLLGAFNEYLHQLKKEGIKHKEFIIELSVGINFYLSIAKIRAIHILIEQLLAYYQDLNVDFTIRAKTSGYYTSHKDEHTNLLRHTSMALSAVIAGVDGLNVQPFEKANSLSLRMARNIQHILKEESYMDKVEDMISGAYFFEELTLTFIDKAWDAFRKIEDSGGFVALMATGEIKEMLQRSHLDRVEKYKSKEATMIGVNKYLSPDEEVIDIPVDPIRTEAWVLPRLTLSLYI